MRQNRFTQGAGRLAMVAMLIALSVAVLYLASIAPSGRLGLTAAAGLFSAAALVSGGLPAGFLCYAGSGLLALVLSADKAGVILYLVFFGLYPILKHLIERLKRLPVEWLFKLMVFNGALALLWWAFRAVLLGSFPPYFERPWVLWCAGNVGFILYDLGFSRLMAFYYVRIHSVVFRR